MDELSEVPDKAPRRIAIAHLVGISSLILMIGLSASTFPVLSR